MGSIPSILDIFRKKHKNITKQRFSHPTKSFLTTRTRSLKKLFSRRARPLQNTPSKYKYLSHRLLKVPTRQVYSNFIQGSSTLSTAKSLRKYSALQNMSSRLQMPSYRSSLTGKSLKTFFRFTKLPQTSVVTDSTSLVRAILFQTTATQRKLFNRFSSKQSLGASDFALFPVYNLPLYQSAAAGFTGVTPVSAMFQTQQTVNADETTSSNSSRCANQFTLTFLTALTRVPVSPIYFNTPATSQHIPNSTWANFLKKSRTLGLDVGVRSANVQMKRKYSLFYSFYTYWLSGEQLALKSKRLMLPDYKDTLRGLVQSDHLTSSQFNRCFLQDSLELRPKHELSSPNLYYARRGAVKKSSSLRKLPRGFVSVDKNRSNFLFQPTKPLNFLDLGDANAQLSPVKAAPKQVRRAYKRFRKLSRSFKRFLRRFKSYGGYLLRRTRSKVKSLGWKSRKKLRWLKRKLLYSSRAQKQLVRRSGVRYKTFLWIKNRSKVRLNIEAPDEQFLRRQKGTYFQKHNALRKKFVALLSARNQTEVSRLLVFSTSLGSQPLNLGSRPLSTPSSVPSDSRSLTYDVFHWAPSALSTGAFSSCPLLWKYLLTRYWDNSSAQDNPLSSLVDSSQFYKFQGLALATQNQLQTYQPLDSSVQFRCSNLWATSNINYTIRKRLLRHVTSNFFSIDLSVWYYKTLIQFIENCSGRKTTLLLGPFIENSLSFEDRARCTLWNNRVTGFQRIMGSRIFVHEALAIVVMSIRLQDPTFLSNWIRGMLRRLSFWKYRLIFRYLKFVLRYVLKPNFHLLDFRGVKLRLKGKISVAGNARTRTLFMRIGDTSHSKMTNRVAYDLSYVNTFTGILGFKLWFFY